MAHGRTEIVMPIGAVQAIVLIKVHHIGHSWQVITRTRHISCAVFDINFKGSSNRWVIPGASRDEKIVDLLVALIDIDALHAQIDVNPTLALIYTPRPPGVLIASPVCFIFLCFFCWLGRVRRCG